jgi:hypothetical protein
LAELRFKLKSEAQRSWISETIARLTVNGFAGSYRSTVKPGREQVALWPVLNRMSVACRLS